MTCKTVKEVRKDSSQVTHLYLQCDRVLGSKLTRRLMTPWTFRLLLLLLLLPLLSSVSFLIHALVFTFIFIFISTSAFIFISIFTTTPMTLDAIVAIQRGSRMTGNLGQQPRGCDLRDVDLRLIEFLSSPFRIAGQPASRAGSAGRAATFMNFQNARANCELSRRARHRNPCINHRRRVVEQAPAYPERSMARPPRQNN